MMCAACVARAQGADPSERSGGVRWSIFAVGGLLFAWLIFYYLGMGLARIPSTFHTGLVP
jgi:hypothetical protein